MPAPSHDQLSLPTLWRMGALALAPLLFFGALGVMAWTGGASTPPASEARDETTREDAAKSAVTAAKSAGTSALAAKAVPDANNAGDVSLDELTVLPLEELSPAAAAYAENFGGIGVAVVIPEAGIAYVENPDIEFPMLSTAKVPIMLAVLQQAIDEQRALTEYEKSLLHDMITYSDNDAAYALWYEAGGAEGIDAYLDSIGVWTTQNPYSWGESGITALEAAELMAKLESGQLLNAPSTSDALSLLGGVDESQAWGAVAGAPEGDATGVKNGWYPEYYGWLLNSVGFVQPEDGPDYTVAVYTAGWSTFGFGVSAIETIAAPVHRALAAQ